MRGSTWHGRRGAIRDSFRYRLDLVLLDPEAEVRAPLFRRNRWALASVHDRDHGGPRGRGEGAAWARRAFETAGLAPGFRLLLLTQPRWLGLGFNPVSFWFAFADPAAGCSAGVGSGSDAGVEDGTGADLDVGDGLGPEAGPVLGPVPEAGPETGLETRPDAGSETRPGAPPETAPASGPALVAVIAEVNNTFGDRHGYLCARPGFAPIGPGDVTTARKVFHVSPFQDVAGDYSFRFEIREDAVAIRIGYRHGAEGVVATYEGERLPLTAPRLLRAAPRFPFAGLRAITLIHWRALRLWLKGAAFRPRPAPPAEDLT